MSISIGSLREDLDLFLPMESNMDGVVSEGYAFHSTVFGQVVHLTGSELEQARKANAKVSVRFNIRFLDAIDRQQDMQVKWNDQTWDVHGILPDERRSFMMLDASEVI